MQILLTVQKLVQQEDQPKYKNYNAQCFSSQSIIYSCQTWSCTKAQMNNVNATYLSFLRKMIKGGYRRKDNSWAYVFTNRDLLRMARTEDIHTFVSKQQEHFVMKIIRGENTSMQKRLLFNDNDAKKCGPKTSHAGTIFVQYQHACR